MPRGRRLIPGLETMIWLRCHWGAAAFFIGSRATFLSTTLLQRPKLNSYACGQRSLHSLATSSNEINKEVILRRHHRRVSIAVYYSATALTYLHCKHQRCSKFVPPLDWRMPNESFTQSDEGVPRRVWNCVDSLARYLTICRLTLHVRNRKPRQSSKWVNATLALTTDAEQNQTHSCLFKRRSYLKSMHMVAC